MVIWVFLLIVALLVLGIQFAQIGRENQRRQDERMRKNRDVGTMARRVGGYSALIRLERDRRRVRSVGGDPALVRDPDG